MQHYFTEQKLRLHQTFTMDSDIAHHFLSVLRAKKESNFEIVDANQTLFIAKVIDVDQHRAIIIEQTRKNVELDVDVTIVCGLPKKEKAELIVQKATELGVHQVIFTPMNWSIAKWNKKADKKIQRLQKISRSAAEQSHRNIIPRVEYVSSLAQINDNQFDHRLIAYEESAKHGEKSRLKETLKHTKKHETIIIVFGPEGGIAPAEVDNLKQRGYTNCGLGLRILRTETAPLYFLSVVSAYLELK
jgi:16S rRNA (uracil1498-N3)-methyltransferase